MDILQLSSSTSSETAVFWLLSLPLVLHLVKVLWVPLRVPVVLCVPNSLWLCVFFFYILVILVTEVLNLGSLLRLEVSWSRIQFSASCYRACETSGTLELLITRSGRSTDPSYITVQVRGHAHLVATLISNRPCPPWLLPMSMCRWREGGRPSPAETSHTAAADWCSLTQVGH